MLGWVGRVPAAAPGAFHFQFPEPPRVPGPVSRSSNVPAFRHRGRSSTTRRSRTSFAFQYRSRVPAPGAFQYRPRVPGPVPRSSTVPAFQHRGRSSTTRVPGPIRVPVPLRGSGTPVVPARPGASQDHGRPRTAIRFPDGGGRFQMKYRLILIPSIKILVWKVELKPQLPFFIKKE